MVSYITKKLERIFKRLEMVLKNFFNNIFGSIDFISLGLQQIFLVYFKYKQLLH